MRIMAVTNQKGGVGKTTTAVNVAAALTLAGRSVLLIDADVQAQAGISLGLRPDVGLAEVLLDEATLQQAIVQARPNLYLLGGGQKLTLATRAIDNMVFGAERHLANSLASMGEVADYIIVDTSPSWNSLLVNVLLYVSEILAPLGAEPLSFQGFLTFMRSVDPIVKHREGALQLRYVLPTAVDRRRLLTEEVLSQLEANFGQYLLPPIPLNVRLSEAAAHGEHIFEYAPTSSGAQAYEAVTQAIIADENGEK